ncbi:unnamed protein product [Urochloa decumbens]|uniref:Uncharacterized protein n=1 Tax=Urochloa decumbens TaxID=240449 RepID=A0ABC9DUP1_9POAL
MSFRRFVYLVTKDVIRRNFPLRRIDTSRFFLPQHKRDQLLLTDTNPPPPLEEEAKELPPVAIAFDPPTSIDCNEDMEFMLFPGGGAGGRNDKVVATDLTGRIILYDPESHSVRSLPGFSTPKFAPISVAGAGDASSYYVLDTDFTFNNRAGCFDRFFHGGAGDDWRCQSLPPPPYVYSPYLACGGSSHVDSYAVVSGAGAGGSTSSSIWISQTNLGTHCFDTASRVWTKAGDWTLPFSGHVQYVPEHKLWFGLPSADVCGEDDDGSIYAASDLSATTPGLTTIRKVWGDLTPPEWTSKSSCLVHLGHSKFCLARLFQIERCPLDLDYLSFVVFTGLEAELCGNAVRVVKH